MIKGGGNGLSKQSLGHFNLQFYAII
jgi:hypothetical protein